MMKQIIYLFITLILSSCVDQASSDIEYILFNQTDKSVKVLGFETLLDINNNIGKANPIVINPNSSFKVTRMTGIDSDIGFRFYSIQGVDSVRVIFENLKVNVYSKNISPITEFSIFRGNSNYQHFITEQDYENAEDCNGNCD